MWQKKIYIRTNREWGFDNIGIKYKNKCVRIVFDGDVSST